MGRPGIRGLGRTTANLASYRRQWDRLLTGLPSGTGPDISPDPGRLVEVEGFGSNPGNLRMLAHVPERLAPSPALVVVLHGCTQTAAGYDEGAGWSTLADRYGFAVLAPEQKRSNNPKNCFTWFEPSDTKRGRGEALSIRQMVNRMVQDHSIDRSRVFVTGLSAGGAMTAVMLATYPDVFASGAIIAGLPYGTAGNVQEAFESMFQGRTRPASEWGDLVRAASPHRGPWPRVSVWHGTADSTVTHANAGELIKQWTNVHGLALEDCSQEAVSGYPRRVWQGRDGTALVEEYTITGMAHGTPLAIDSGDVPHGAAGPFLLDVGIASSFHIASFFGLIDGSSETTAAQPIRSREEAGTDGGSSARSDSRTPPKAEAVQAIINKALRAAGLLDR